jgi:hypothetical protein
MEWNVPFVIYRISADGKLEEVFHAADLKMAKYWLTYIAQPGDVLCKTPLHPKHSKSSKSPEYWSHKEVSGVPAQNEPGWKEQAEKRNFKGAFPDEQEREASNSTANP